MGISAENPFSDLSDLNDNERILAELLDITIEKLSLFGIEKVIIALDNGKDKYIFGKFDEDFAIDFAAHVFRKLRSSNFIALEVSPAMVNGFLHQLAKRAADLKKKKDEQDD